MKKILLYVTLCVFTLTSCNDFLDVKPSNQLDISNTGQSIFTTDEARVMLTGIMRAMTSSDYYGRNFIMYGEAKGGFLTVPSQGRGLDALYTFNHSASTNSYSGYWLQIYFCILQANMLLNDIDKLIAAGNTDNLLLQYKAEVRTARAMFYYDLIRLYGKPYDMDKTSYGVPLTLDPLGYTAQPTRASVEDVYVQILKDLTEDAEFLSKTKREGFISYYTNLAVQAKVYLQMQNYDAALAAAEEIINSSLYKDKLYSNSEWVGSWTKQFGSESIFELGIYPNEADLGTSSLGYYLRRKNHGGSAASGWFIASKPFLDNLLGEDPDDVRWGVMDYDEKSSSRLGACYKYSGAVNKTSTGAGATFVGDGKATASAVNIKVIRLSEIYLIAAEAAFSKPSPDKEKAAGYLQEIRKRAPNLTPADENNITLDMILNEKGKELFAEGQRYFDMIRLNKSITFDDASIESGDVVIPTRPVTIDRTFYKTILPISLGEINANPAIKDQQNPGY
ncbi:MAG: RagB/SusD family nutrient uptake outer membrane protein [Prevotellaceae bacterium]|jgi:tetratricopeptide (TPR) repeat protein|nr:RagB/SusD family nutrient uptake outer membrane protein [Prevotellaceae bacterium]